MGGGGFKILNFIILRGFQENEYFFWGGGGGMKILWIFFFLGGGVITKFDYIKESFLCILESFLKVKVQNGEFFGGC